MIDLIKQLKKLDEHLTNRSVSRFEYCRANIEDMMRDPRIKAVRNILQIKPFDAFVKNYFDGAANYTILSRQKTLDTFSESIEVESKLTGEIF